ncbi:AAA family ATPase [Niveibacterium sp. SC-1]|uniref:AAA family ATPase n=1 Tax=Niveibacterium sp. SC-1 TaxID=3135646 RepID=UPI00311E9ED8
MTWSETQRALAAVDAQIRRNGSESLPADLKARDKVDPGKKAPPSREVILTSGAQFGLRPISWLWRNWLARGKLTLLAGEAGVGKTTLSGGLVATTTAAGRWPDGAHCDEPGNCVIWSGEDDIADTLAPRLVAAGADMERVHFVEGVRDERGQRVSFDLARDLPKLCHAVKALRRCDLVVIDPLVLAIAGDMHKANDVRAGLQPLLELAATCQASVVGITHFAKGTVGGRPLERVIGSQAFGAVARVVLAAGRREGQSDCVLVRAKSNIGPTDGGVSYTLERCPVGDGIEASRVLWGEVLEGSARELLGDLEEPFDKSSFEEAKALLQDLLREGPLLQSLVRQEAKSAGVSAATLRRAKQALGVVSAKLGLTKGWAWGLPSNPAISEGAHENRI